MSALEDTQPPPATQIRQACSPGRRAVILLRLPDAVIAALGSELLAACADCQFDLGTRFLHARLAALHAVRDRLGKLPERTGAPLELWRTAMISCAGRS